ncbi:MAG: prepilin-type N-terminal cleavage/methylation domain-containing protein [Kiritimatiellae bacterium]|jgi:prepilin-type N-terminal cleavage/methylation domain-containing protein|nr:prepilin-type N-terminal cleavage/methylation domain-containing protein [Kiritimatiellia bacterium]
MNNNKKAFTLIEILVAMVILTVGFSIIFRSYQFCVQTISTLSEKNVTNVLINRVYNDLTIQIMTNNFELPPLESQFAAPYEAYSYQMELSLMEFDDFDDYQIENDGNLYNLNVTVKKTDSDQPYSCSTKIYLPKEVEP